MLDALLRQLVYLLEPIGFLWFCLLVLTAALWWKRQRRFACTTGLLAVFLTVIGSTPIPGDLLGSLERPYAGVQLEALPTADAIVMLGGCATASRYEAGGVHFTYAGDRIVMAHALFRMGKAPLILLGGNVTQLDGVIRFEAEIVRDLFVTWGVPKEAMIPLAGNESTREEALKVRTVAAERGLRRVLLVTSANHMRRASATLRAQGLDVIPVPCNFLTSVATDPVPTRLAVPRSDGFAKAAIWLHEAVGWHIYRRRGWIVE